MKNSLTKFIIGIKATKILIKVIQYKSKKSEGGRKLTAGESSHLGRLCAELGRAIIEKFIWLDNNERKIK